MWRSDSAFPPQRKQLSNTIKAAVGVSQNRGFTTEPRVITVLPPHRCYGDCWATVTDQRPQCPYLCVRGWAGNVCRHRICSTSCCDLWYTDNAQGRSYHHLRWGWGITEGLLFKSATIKCVISCPWASTQGWILTRTFNSLSVLTFIWNLHIPWGVAPGVGPFFFAPAEHQERPLLRAGIFD